MRLSLSFFLTTPAKNPRTECCCQSVAFMIAAIVVPLGWCSSFSTADCLDEDAGDFDDAAFEVAFDAAVGFGRAATLLLTVRFAARDDLRAAFADVDLDLLVAIWPSSEPTTASCAATDTTPPKGGAGRRAERSLFVGEAVQQRGCILKPPGLVDQLFDVHRNGDAFDYAACQGASFRGFGNAGSVIQAAVDFAQQNLDGLVCCGAVHECSIGRWAQ